MTSLKEHRAKIRALKEELAKVQSSMRKPYDTKLWDTKNKLELLALIEDNPYITTPELSKLLNKNIPSISSVMRRLHFKKAWTIDRDIK